MGRVLAKTVLANGRVFPAGTEWTKDLGDAVPDRFWSGDAAPQPEPDGAPSESWKVADLRGFASEQGIDLEGASTKADILAAIAKHHEAADGESDDDASEDDESDDESN